MSKHYFFRLVSLTVFLGSFISTSDAAFPLPKPLRLWSYCSLAAMSFSTLTGCEPLGQRCHDSWSHSTPEAQEEWSRWSQKFASSSPLVARLKTNANGENVLELERIFHGQNVARIYPNENYQLDLRSSDLALDLNRHTVMVDRILELHHHLKSNELLLVRVGYEHGIELFLRLPRESQSQFLFVSYPYARNIDAFGGSPEALAVRISLGTEKYQNAEFLEQMSFPVSLYTALKNVHDKHIPVLAEWGDFLKETDGERKTIVFLENHDLQSTAHIDQLPSAKTLQGLGIQKLIVAVEGYSPSTNLSVDQLQKDDLQLWNLLRMRNQLCLDYFELRLKLNPPQDPELLSKLKMSIFQLQASRWALFLKPNIIQLPMENAFYKRMDEFQNDMPIEVHGIDTDDLQSILGTIKSQIESLNQKLDALTKAAALH